MAVNGKVESMDVFESTPLFRQLWPKLLKSYALDAMNAERDTHDPQNLPASTQDDAKQFLTKTFTAGESESKTSKNTRATTRDSDDVVSFSFHEHRAAPAEAAGGFGGGGFGGGVHTSGFSK